LIRSERYGSPRQNVKQLKIAAAKISANGRTLSLTLPEIEPVWQMEVRYDLKGANGEGVTGRLQNTIHTLGEPPR
jgi:hypothetical protein